LMLNGRWANLEYGSWAPGAPQVFIGDADLRKLWVQPERYYLLTFDSALPHYGDLIGPGELYTVTRSGAKVLLTNHALTQSELQNPSASELARPLIARIITDER
jgi:hypothetical protein